MKVRRNVKKVDCFSEIQGGMSKTISAFENSEDQPSYNSDVVFEKDYI